MDYIKKLKEIEKFYSTSIKYWQIKFELKDDWYVLASYKEIDDNIIKYKTFTSFILQEHIKIIDYIELINSWLIYAITEVKEENNILKSKKQ